VFKLPDGQYAAYLRKSRADLEAESRGEEDTYVRHERILLDLTKRYGISLTKIYRESPITGERISARPEMLQLLEDVESQRWTGILVVEVERLARGDTMDQGEVAQAFKYSNTLIVTPMRIFDPTNPDDEEYFEFGLFMSRREFKTITRRLQSGRVSSIKEGKYVGNKPPYGYVRVKLPGKGYSLEPHPEQAPTVKLIFSLYTDTTPGKRMGTAKIAAYLNNVLKVPTANNKSWTVATINGMLRNTTYIGFVRWGSRPQVKKRDGNSRPRRAREQWIEERGLHKPLIDEVTFNKARDIMNEHGHSPNPTGRVSNPLAGLVKCGVCGFAVVHRPHGDKNPPMLICSKQYCKNIGSYYSYVEARVLQALRDWLNSYKAQWMGRRPKNHSDEQLKVKALEDMLKTLHKKLNELTEQKGNLHDLLERRVYTVDEYMERSQIIAQRLTEIKEEIEKAERELTIEQQRYVAKVDMIPKVEHVLEVYDKTDDAAEKNELLKSVLEKVVYRKDKGGRWSGAMDQFELILFPKLPK